MNREGHLWLNVFFSATLFLLLFKLDFKDLILYSLPSYFTTILPDLIEPSITYNHRNYFHSKRFFKILVVSLIGFLILAVIKSETYFFWFFGVLGYLLHLIGDSITWKSLPN